MKPKTLIVCLKPNSPGVQHYAACWKRAVFHSSTASSIGPGEIGPGGIHVNTRGTPIGMALDAISIIKWFRLCAAVNSLRPDFIVITGPHPLNLAIQLMGRLVKSHCFVHLHDPRAHSGVKYAAAIHFFQGLSIRLASKVIVFGKHLAGEVSKLGMPSATIIHHPWVLVDPAAGLPFSSRSKFLFSLVGRMSPYKGIDKFLIIAEALMKTRKDVYFCIVGSGKLDEYQDRIDRLGDNIIIVNRYVKDAEMAAVLTESCATIMPYSDATQSGVTPFAFASGCPVIVSDVGGLGEYVNNGLNGHVVPKGSVNDWISAMNQTISNRPRLSEGAMMTYQEYFSQARFDRDVSCLLSAT